MIHLLLVLALAGQATSALRPLTEEEKKFVEAVSRPVLLNVAGIEKVRVLGNVTYEQTADGPMLADIYLPPAKMGKRPIAVFIHGGVGPDVPLRPKDWGIYKSWGRTIATSGFVGVVFNQRLGYPETRIRDAGADLDELLAYVAAHASEWNADANRIALLAFSAGGPLLSRPLRDHPPNIRCLVSFYNFLDISKTLEHPKYETPETIREFSPSNAVSAQSPPILVIRAGKDQIPKLNESIAAFVARAIEVNAPLTFMIHPTAPHGFDTRTDDARTREILETVIDFLKRHTAVH